MKTLTNTTRSGFTLIELLVVISIIGILMAVLTAGLSAARASAAAQTATERHEQLTSSPPTPAGKAKSLEQVIGDRLDKKKAELQAMNENPRGRSDAQAKREAELVDDIAALMAAQKEAKKASPPATPPTTKKAEKK